MKTLLRALVGLSGLLSILMALGLWFGMERILPATGPRWRGRKPSGH
jgi:hypothetical protein